MTATLFILLADATEESGELLSLTLSVAKIFIVRFLLAAARDRASS